LNRDALDAQAAELSGILAHWHRWQEAYKHGKGYPSRSAGCGDWRASTQWDSMNGALDNDQANERMGIVEFEVQQIEQPGRTGLYVNARALALGLSVFRSPRLPEDQIACLEIIAGARDELTRRLRGRGVL
jgi:hypothetical protein